ncbi:MAG: hypothetical protein R2851_17770 [Caldilineaceae bacterium]
MTTIHTRHDPLFGGRSPLTGLRVEPTHQHRALRRLRSGLWLWTATLIASPSSTIGGSGFISTNELLLLLYYYPHEIRGEPGGVTRNLATTHPLDRLAAHFGEACHEVPVGFKHLADSMKRHNVLLAGESSGGLSIRGHILARTASSPAGAGGGDDRRHRAPHLRAAGRRPRHHRAAGEPRGQPAGHVGDEGDGTAKLAKADLRTIAASFAGVLSHEDGTKFYLEHDNWLLLRFSGTEPLLRIFAEADDDATADALIAWADELVHT